MSGITAASTPFQIGTVLSHTLSIFMRAIGRFLVLALIPLVPLLLVQLTGYGARSGSPTFNIGVIVVSVLSFILGIIANATTLYGAFSEMRSESFTIGKSLSVGLARLVPVIGVSLLVGLAAGVATLALVIPGLIVMCMYYVAIPVCVVERLGVLDSLSRSGALTKGYRWQIFAIILIVAIVAIVVGGGLTYVLVSAVGTGLVTIVLAFAWQVAAAAFGAVLSAVIYHDLRVAKEGVDVSRLANVFD